MIDTGLITILCPCIRHQPRDLKVVLIIMLFVVAGSHQHRIPQNTAFGWLDLVIEDVEEVLNAFMGSIPRASCFRNTLAN